MIKKMELCKARHNIEQAIDGSIFDNQINPLDIQSMDNTVREVLKGVTVLHLYVTGLTVALVSVINYCHSTNIKLILWHYDRNTDDYYRQDVV